MLTRRGACALLLTVTLALVCAVAHADAGAEHTQRRSALALELRLLAPCCWVQTLDVHESELATALRSEMGADPLRRCEVA
jgi:cytochrome c-type biogenesis protein CcmH